VIEGDADKLHDLFDLLEEFQLMFPVLEPHKAELEAPPASRPENP